MNRIELALQRLGQAVNRLEEAGHQHLQLMADSVHDQDTVQELTARLAAVRSDYESLQLTSQQASGRIDAAIGRLRAVLES